MRFFLDTEWADDSGYRLVSLALVSEDGTHSFYSEVLELPQAPTKFVGDVVYPLLERGAAARGRYVFTRDLRLFLARFGASFVLFDYRVDGELFRYALTGFDLPSTILGDLPSMPNVSTTLIAREDVREGIDQYFDRHPELVSRKHHAGVDAEALRWAFIRALERQS